jgi:hypothetical protein
MGNFEEIGEKVPLKLWNLKSYTYLCKVLENYSIY